MKNKKLSLENFASNELSSNQKKAIVGKGDLTAMLGISLGGVSLTTSTVNNSPTTEPGPGDGNTKGNGDGRGV
ncbi:hypothetical protein FEDK69T_09480 [Flavobacterium enshiense DK69]|uniref:Uncharacterized protein n=1 Tax=Flavobacterium enshiense DK69 TaxID=1107311 RepID=V6SJ90_9FLAO|nr:hypothetical protein [Flavobacterium enshiense]ESU24500.1 hypothetical protein FEDK69T_09480 [Flavobacterium enshiense DK69]KGO93844.1 hypothetical protein Q767_14315 [Flavobacterium enshiense DK69]